MDTGLALMSYHFYDDCITQHMDCVNLLRIFVFSLVLLSVNMWYLFEYAGF